MSDIDAPYQRVQQKETPQGALREMMWDVHDDQSRDPLNPSPAPPPSPRRDPAHRVAQSEVLRRFPRPGATKAGPFDMATLHRRLPVPWWVTMGLALACAGVAAAAWMLIVG